MSPKEWIGTRLFHHHTHDCSSIDAPLVYDRECDSEATEMPQNTTDFLSCENVQYREGKLPLMKSKFVVHGVGSSL